MIGAIYHTPQYIVYVWPGFIFWGFDRLLRVCRLAVYNVFLSPSMPTNTARGAGETTVELLSDDTIRLSIRRSKNRLLSWRPGQHFYVTAPGSSSLPWEAHPFTSASIPNDIDGTPSPDVNIDFIIRGRNGFTGRLLSRAVIQDGLTTLGSKRFLVDGPYGEAPNLGVYDTTILIAGEPSIISPCICSTSIDSLVLMNDRWIRRFLHACHAPRSYSVRVYFKICLAYSS